MFRPLAPSVYASWTAFYAVFCVFLNIFFLLIYQFFFFFANFLLDFYLLFRNVVVAYLLSRWFVIYVSDLLYNFEKDAKLHSKFAQKS